MRSANVLLVEDDMATERLVHAAMRHSVHHIIDTLDDVELTDLVLHGVIERQQSIDVVILDGNLSPQARDYSDARYVLGRLAAFGFDPKVIGFSGNPFPKDIPLDIDASKARVLELPAIIDTFMINPVPV